MGILPAAHPEGCVHRPLREQLKMEQRENELIATVEETTRTLDTPAILSVAKKPTGCLDESSAIIRSGRRRSACNNVVGWKP